MEVIGIPDHEEGGVIGEGLTSALLLGEGDSLDVFGEVDLDEKDFYHEDEQIMWGNITLWNSTLKEDPVHQVASHHDTGISSLEEMSDPIENAITESEEFHIILNVRMR